MIKKISSWYRSRYLGGKKAYFALSLCFVAFGIVIGLFTSLVNYQLQYANIHNELAQRAIQEREQKFSLIRRELNRLEQQVQALSSNPITQRLIEQPSEAARLLANDLFLSVAHSNDTLMQVRYLDASGMEVVRVDRNKFSGELQVIDSAHLQNKASRYYFSETAAREPDQFWYSEVDLNVENGQIEMPPRPTFRVAKSIHSDGHFAGIVIINADVQGQLEELVRSVDFDIVLIDASEEVLFHPDPLLSWSNYLSDRQSFFQLHPDFTGLIDDSDLEFAESEYAYFSLSPGTQRERQLFLVMRPKEQTLANLQRGNLAATGLIALVVMAVSFPLSWLAAMYPAALQRRLHEALGRLRRSNRLLDQNVLISETDPDGVITGVSAAFCKTTGYSRADLLGKTHSVVRHPNTSHELYQELWSCIAAGNTWRGEFCNRMKNQSEFWISSVVTPKYGERGQIIGYMQISQDINDKKAIEKLMVTDVLTGLANRRKLDEVLETELQRYQRYQQRFSVILMDLDHFKSVNDQHGHQAGDLVLQKSAKQLLAQVRQADCLGRWGAKSLC